MKRVVFGFVPMLALIFVAGWLAAYVLFGRIPLKDRAVRAYESKDYPKALALFKEYGETAAVRQDMKEQQFVQMYQLDIKNKLASGAAAATSSAADLMAQAMSFATQPNAADGDIATGADRIPHKKPAYGEVLAMSIKQMANFDFEPTTDKDVPADIKLLEGARVKLTGYMIPLTQAEKINAFALVPSLVGCCFGVAPGVQHTVTCRTAPDQAIDYAIDELEIEGILHVRVKREEDYTNSIFELDVTSAKVRE